MKNEMKYAAKALVAVVVTAAAYLGGVLTGDQTLAELTTQEWALGVVFVGSAFGFTYGVKNGSKPERGIRLRDLDAD